jgi:FtsP/CotA-like multicopper oxidase with cupredoxin domain
MYSKRSVWYTVEKFAFRAGFPAFHLMHSRSLALAVATLLWFAPAKAGALSASPPEAQSTSAAPENWDADLQLPQPADINPDPRIVEINLTAKVADVEVAPGKRVHAWTYNGGLPGPLIRARVGDRLIVHFENELPQPTTVHWHGVRVPIEMDGVPGISQPEVQPGESFVYDFVLRDAALYWYHPHVMSAASSRKRKTPSTSPIG